MQTVKSAGGGQVPLSTFTTVKEITAPLAVNHEGQFPSATISFDLAAGYALGDAVNAIEAAEKQLGMPASIQASFQGTAQAFRASLTNEPLLILAAVITVYIVLGVLYESYVHPLTILSTLSSAGVGAILALQICRMDLNVIALIGIILLIRRSLHRVSAPAGFASSGRLALTSDRARRFVTTASLARPRISSSASQRLR